MLTSAVSRSILICLLLHVLPSRQVRKKSVVIPKMDSCSQHNLFYLIDFWTWLWMTVFTFLSSKICYCHDFWDGSCCITLRICSGFWHGNLMGETPCIAVNMASLFEIQLIYSTPVSSFTSYCLHVYSIYRHTNTWKHIYICNIITVNCLHYNTYTYV